MSSCENHDIAFNLEFYKWIRFYRLFDPNGLRVFNCHFYRLAVTVLVVLIQLVIIFGAFGFNGKTEGSKKTVADSIILLNFFISNSGVLLKICSFTYKANNVWQLLYVTRIDFLKSSCSLQYKSKLEECRKKLVSFSYYVIGLSFMMITLWIVSPLIARMKNMNGNNGNEERYANIFNLPYPMNTNAYNQYFCVFYVIEVLIALYFLLAILIDFFILSVCIVIIIQYVILAETFATVGDNDKFKMNKSENTELEHPQCNSDFSRGRTQTATLTESIVIGKTVLSQNENPSKKKYIDDFKSILVDQKELYLKLKLFYSVVRPIVLSNVTFYSITEIVFTYSFIEIFKSPETVTILSVVKVAMTMLFLVMQLFLYCYIFGFLHDKVESVNFGIYCSDWTSMDLHFQKLMLLTMRMSDVIKLSIRATPTKTVNLFLFVIIIRISYNILTFMLNTIN